MHFLYRKHGISLDMLRVISSRICFRILCITSSEIEVLLAFTGSLGTVCEYDFPLGCFIGSFVLS